MVNTIEKGVDLPFIRSPYNYDREAVSDATGLKCEDPSLAQQHFKEETDINYIVDTFTRTGTLPQSSMVGQFGDFTHATDYKTALDAVIHAQDAFMTLPAAVRSRFANDPGQLLDFIADDKNRDEAVKLGLVPPLAAASETGAVGASPIQTASAPSAPGATGVSSPPQAQSST